GQVAGVAPVLGVVDLAGGRELGLDDVAVADACVGEDRVGLGVGARLGGRRGEDGNPVEADHLGKRRRCLGGDIDLDLLVAKAGGRGHGHRVPAFGIGDLATGRAVVVVVAL